VRDPELVVTDSTPEGMFIADPAGR
jgi:hypothetical protein